MSPPRDFQAGYVRRVVDDELDELFAALPAISLDGPKGVGKTATSLQRAATIRRLDRNSDREILNASLDRIELDPTPVLLDERQRLPALWDAVRRRVDDNSAGGRFLLTGSTPASLTGDNTHSGAGRITILRMRPLALNERLDLDPTVSFRSLVDGTADTVG